MKKFPAGHGLMMLGCLALLLGIAAADSPAPGHLYAAGMVLGGCLMILVGDRMMRKRARHEAHRGTSADAAPELLGALQDLYDIQNGPPLIEYAAEWEAAMAKAREVMNATPKPGWTCLAVFNLPPGWELREDEDCLFLCTPEGEAYPYGRRTLREVIESDAWEQYRHWKTGKQISREV